MCNCSEFQSKTLFKDLGQPFSPGNQAIKGQAQRCFFGSSTRGMVVVLTVIFIPSFPPSYKQHVSPQASTDVSLSQHPSHWQDRSSASSPASLFMSVSSLSIDSHIHATLSSTSQINPLLNSQITAPRVPTLSLKTNLSHFTQFDGANGGSELAVPPVQCCLTGSIHISTHFCKHVQKS